MDPDTEDRETEDRDTEDREPQPEIVAACDYETGVIPLARPGVVVWLEDDAPDEDEIRRARAMRAHPSNGSDEDPGQPHLRAVS